MPNVARLVRLRDIVWQEHTTLMVRGLKADGDRAVGLPRPAGRKRVSKTFAVPGYPGAKAKLLVFRARKRFRSERNRFRHGGILVKSRHAIHEATLFDRGLEWDSHAQWFFGRLTCEAIDDLWNEYDERQARGDPHPPENPVPILDPSRKTGLTPDHPFVEALYARALAMLRPLVEEERTREERERESSVESRKTRKRLDALEKAANQFMEDFSDEEMSRDPKSREKGSQFQSRGYSLTPQYAQVVRGHSFKCWLTVRSEAFPEIGEGQPVRVRCLTDEIRADAAGVPLAEARGAGGRVAGDLVGQGAGGRRSRPGSRRASAPSRRSRRLPCSLRRRTGTRRSPDYSSNGRAIASAAARAGASGYSPPPGSRGRRAVRSISSCHRTTSASRGREGWS